MMVNRNIVLSTLVFVLLAASLGAVLSSDMMMQDGTMQNCPFMGVTALCGMNALEHAALWQQMFASIVAPMATIVVLFLISLLVLMRFVEDLSVRKRLTIKFFYRRHEAHSVDSLRLAFARGLIHPKIF